MRFRWITVVAAALVVGAIAGYLISEFGSSPRQAALRDEADLAWREAERSRSAEAGIQNILRIQFASLPEPPSQVTDGIYLAEISADPAMPEGFSANWYGHDSLAPADSSPATQSVPMSTRSAILRPKKSGYAVLGSTPRDARVRKRFFEELATVREPGDGPTKHLWEVTVRDGQCILLIETDIDASS